MRQATMIVSSLLSYFVSLARIADAPVITRPMDFMTMSKNVKSQRYKNKAEFAADLDLIWENCLFFNTQEVSYPLIAPSGH